MGQILIRWRGDQLNAQIKRQMQSAVDEGAQALVDECRRVVGEPYPPPSSPGEPPHRRTGTGQRAIGFRSGNLIAQLTLDKIGGYMYLFLELGTRYILPRPWFRPTFQRMRTGITRLVRDRLESIFK